MLLMPAIFLHGNPMNALRRDRYTERWAQIGADLRSRRRCFRLRTVTSPGRPLPSTLRRRPLIDFGGFPRELYEVQYPRLLILK